MSQGKNWIFTLNNPVQTDHDDLAAIDCKYLIYGDEIAPSSGTPHLQGYIVFKSNKRFSTVQKVLPPRCHIEKAKGSTEQNIAYCSKEGWVTERGDRPMNSKEKGQCNADRYKEAFLAAKEGRLDDIPEDMRTRHYSTYKQIAKDYMQKPDELEYPYCGIWIHGKSGAGKSHAVARAYPERYIKPRSKWWDGYRGEEVVHLDEVNPDMSQWISAFLKDWGHQYPFHAETKGGAMLIRPKKFIITSNYTIDEMGFKENDIEPIKLRFKEVLKVREQNLLL